MKVISSTRQTRLARFLTRESAFVVDESQHEKSDFLTNWREDWRKKYPGLRLDAYETPQLIELTDIEVVEKNQGLGTKIIKSLQEYARSVNKPIVLRPHPEPRKKQALMRFYKNLGFVVNKGRKTDYTLSSPFSLTLYWKP